MPDENEVPERFREKSCLLFASAITEAGYNVADAIAESLEAEEKPTTLRDDRCRNLFVAEWLRARWPYIRLHVRRMHNEVYRNLMLRVIEEALAEIGPLHPSVPFGLGMYSTYADDFDHPGPSRSVADLPFLAGHSIAECYRLVLENAPEDLRLPTPSKEELSRIQDVALTDVWPLNGDLDELLPAVANTEHESRKEKLAEVYGPLGKLGQAIVGAAWESYQRLAEHLGFSLRETPSKRQIRLFYELLFFFMHLTLRTAVAGGLTRPQITKLQDYLGLLLSGTAVDTFFRNWPEERKAGIKSEFFENLNGSELEYAKCRELMLKGEPYEDRSLFGRLQHNIGELFETVNPISLEMAKHVPAEAFMRMQLDQLISEVATVIDSVDADALAGFEFEGFR